MDGREAVREWIQKVMAPFPHMRFPSEWQAYDEENGAIVIHIKNWLDHPTDPDGEPFWFPNWTRLVYAGDNLWSSEEDIYNPRRDAARVVGGWLGAGGGWRPTRSPARSTAERREGCGSRYRVCRGRAHEGVDRDKSPGQRQGSPEVGGEELAVERRDRHVGPQHRRPVPPAAS